MIMERVVTLVECWDVWGSLASRIFAMLFRVESMFS